MFSRGAGPPLDRAWLERLASLVAHRGPDGRGTFVRGARGLSATRLAVQGDHRAEPPLRSPDGRIVVAFNGEILPGPAASLRRLVRVAGEEPPPVAAGDGPLVAHALAVLARRGLSGPPLLDLLEGSMAALVAWDLETEDVWLARDRLGIKPLHVLVTDEALVCASELRVLLAAVPAAAAPDPDGLGELLAFQRPVRHLPFRGVESLAPGAAWRLDRGGRLARWRGAQGLADLVDREALDLGEAVRALGEAVSQSGREAADVEPSPALLLSGGLDSAAVASAVARPGLLALTGRFPPHGGELDESALAGASVSRAGLVHEIVDLEDGDLLVDLPHVVRALEVPMAGPGSLALWRLYARLRGRTKVVLSGTGGDELLGGYARTALALGRGGAWTEGYEGLRLRIEAAGSDLGARRRAAADRADDLVPLLDPDFAAWLATPEPPGPPPHDAAALEILLEDEIRHTLPMLLHVEDRLSMAHGLEGRPVLCLGDVPRAAARVPLEGLVGPDGEGKRALRLALAGRVPEVVLTDRRKRGFPTPFARAVRGAGREAALAVLEDRRFAERGWWNLPACRRALAEARPDHDRALYAVLSWEHWARTFLDVNPWPRAEDAWA